MKKTNLNLILLVFVLVFGGCTTFKNKLIPTANIGGYKVNVIKSKSKINSDNIIIKGTVFDIETGKPISPPVLLTIGCINVQTSSQGEYFYKTQNFKDDYFFIEVNALGYKTIGTDFLDLTNKNEVKIDFYLAKDDRPFIHCEPEIQTKK
jgi:hypothetical protein